MHLAKELMELNLILSRQIQQYFPSNSLQKDDHRRTQVLCQFIEQVNFPMNYLVQVYLCNQHCSSNSISALLISSLRVTCNSSQVSCPILSVSTEQSTFNSKAMDMGVTVATFINNHLIEVCSMNTLPNSVSCGWMSTVLGFIGALIAFLPSSWRSLTEQREKNRKEDCNKCKVCRYVEVEEGIRNKRKHLVDPFQNRPTVYGTAAAVENKIKVTSFYSS